MIYNIEDNIPFKKLLLFSLQMLLSVFTATALIANICGVNMGAALVGAGLSTIAYSFITSGKSPMFISNSGAFVAPVLIALAAGGYLAVIFGGFVSMLVYSIFGAVFTKIPVSNIYKIFPKALIGAVTVVIGINLMGFIPTYVGETGQWGIVLALITVAATAIAAHYGKGMIKILPFLIGILVGYVAAALITICGWAQIIDWSVFSNMQLLSMPTFACSIAQQEGSIEFVKLIPILILYIAFTISAMMECLSDHAALGGIIGVDLYEDPGLDRIFLGTGIANMVTSFFGGLGACSYGEGVACVGFSKVSSVKVTRTAAIMLILLGFIGPVQAFIASIPACVFAGSAIVLYGFIASSGIKMLQQIDLNEQKNLILVSVVLSLGISGLAIGGTTISLSATALALVVGIILNLVLKETKS